MDNLDIVKENMPNMAIMQQLITKIDSAADFEIQKLFDDLNILGFKIFNHDEIKDYLKKNLDILNKLSDICKKTKEVFPEIDKFGLILKTSYEDSNFKTLDIVLNNNNYSPELEKKTDEFMMSDTFEFLQFSKGLLFVVQGIVEPLANFSQK